MSKRADEHSDLPIPNGWYAVDFARDLHPGDVKSIHYFGQDLVLFRGRSGAAHVLDAYCPHVGAHLGEGGRVMGDTVRCPFHGWQFDGATGNCAKIPYCERIPPKARVRAWEVVERNGFIFVWHHAEGKPPEWDVPYAPEFDDPDWVEPRSFAIEVPIHVQDMHENNMDPVHFEYVHRMTETPPSEVEYGEGGRYTKVHHTSMQETVMGSFEMTLLRESWNIGLSSVRLIGIPNAGLMMFTSTTPIDSNNTVSRWLLTATENLVDVAGEEFMSNITKGVFDDMQIWKNKVHRKEPVFCEADKELSEYRKWVKQFYSHPA